MFNVYKNHLIKTIPRTTTLSITKRTTSLFSQHQQQENASIKRELDKQDFENKYKLQEDLKAGRIKISTKLREQLPKREPLIKNMFVGKIDGELFAYPEAIPKDALHNIRTSTASTEKYFSDYLDKESIKNIIPDDVIKSLKDLNLFGHNILQSWGGQELFTSEGLLASEFESKQISIMQLLHQHRLVTQLIGNHGTSYAIKKYLPKLASGELIGTIAMFEKEGSENGAFQTNAKIRGDEQVFLLNGEKSFVLNVQANVFVVFATTIGADKLGDTKEGLSIFIVDSKNPNILVSPPDSTIGFKGLQQATIQFSNVEISPENVIGHLHEGDEIAQKMIKQSRLQTGILAKCAMSHALEDLTNFVINTKAMGVSLMDSELVKCRLARATNLIYALESMCYLTSGLQDLYKDQDLDVEAAMCKVFAVENMNKIANDIIVTKGPSSLIEGENTEAYFKNSAQLITQGETIDALKLYIGLSGLQHAGVSIF